MLVALFVALLCVAVYLASKKWASTSAVLVLAASLTLLLHVMYTMAGTASTSIPEEKMIVWQCYSSYAILAPLRSPEDVRFYRYLCNMNETEAAMLGVPAVHNFSEEGISSEGDGGSEGEWDGMKFDPIPPKG